jgi:branched-chain amino acid transport system substrate-binding protein
MISRKAKAGRTIIIGIVRIHYNKRREELLMKDAARVLFKGAFVMCLVLGLLFTAVGKPAQAAEPIRIGTIFSISGWAGFAMIEDINAKGGVNGRPLEFYFEDDKSVPTNAVIAATKLIKDKKVVVMVGTSTSDSALAIVPTCEKEQVPFINSGPAYIPFKKWIFSCGPGDVLGATHVIDYAIKDLGAKRIAFMRSTDAYGTLASKVIKGELPKHPGVSMVAEEIFEVTDTNMVPQLTKVKAANPDLIILFTTGGAGAVVAKNYKQLGMTTQVLGGTSLTMPDFVKIAGPIADESNWIFLSQPMMVAEKMSSNDPYRTNVYDPVKKMMQAKYGPTKEINLFHGSSYDAIAGVVQAMKIAGKIDSASIRDALEKVKIEGFLGPFAPSATNHQAAPVDPMRPMVFKNGEWLPYQAKK